MKLFTYRGQRVKSFHKKLKESPGFVCGFLFYYPSAIISTSI